MKRLLIVVAVSVAIVYIGTGAAPDSLAQSAGLDTLRGETPIPDTKAAPPVRKQNTNTGRFERAYRQQPPLIPHNIEKYELDLKVNQCIRCHDWPNNVEEGAPKISETHYTNREGVALDHVARTRWFCTQCHVPQVNARPLVNNEFRSAVEVK